VGKIEDMGTLELLRELRQYFEENPEEARKFREWEGRRG
jgi:hypothetical protein